MALGREGRRLLRAALPDDDELPARVMEAGGVGDEGSDLLPAEESAVVADEDERDGALPQASPSVPSEAPAKLPHIPFAGMSVAWVARTSFPLK